MLQFMKSEVAELNSKKLVQVDMQSTDLQLPNSRIEIGEQTFTTLSTLEPNQQKIPLQGMRAFLQSTTKYLVTRLYLI